MSLPRTSVDAAGRPSELPPGVQVIEQPTPEGASPHATLCVLLVDPRGDVHVIDPGWDTLENRARLERALEPLGTVRSVIATHLHPDHLGLVPWVRDRTGAQLLMHRDELSALHRLAEDAPRAVEQAEQRISEWGVPAIAASELLAVARTTASAEPSTRSVTAWGGADDLHPDLLLQDGDHVGDTDPAFTVLHTPGHTPGSICLSSNAGALLISGDTVLPDIFPGLGLGGPATDPLGDYLDSLDRLRAMPEDTLVVPGHGTPFVGLRARCDALAEHHLRRSREVAALLDLDPSAGVWHLAERMTWTAGWENLHGFYLFSALTQTAMHISHLGRVPS
ncbi:MBL fold metallo-hydrolase [Herbiconiux moechotypicola]|uniref:MBL fold metallo-hydrolase n=1 Tax=Herbiconiux moechotypicola TaxID=637393 RepID=A0ABN3DAI8_9MICO|nr:MBL fold metallo-hydrolase [Herbiconiux moechotypicola]MCS5728951.1 MBL fold metallo-hydrolase [Herbiconiux moechotypicola]